MLQEAERASYDLGSVRLAVSAAEPLPAAVYVRWQERFGVEILDGIGSTEVLHIYISCRPGQVKPGSSGQVVPGYEVRMFWTGAFSSAAISFDAAIQTSSGMLPWSALIKAARVVSFSITIART